MSSGYVIGPVTLLGRRRGRGARERGGEGGSGLPPPILMFFWVFLLDDKTSAPDVFSSCLFIPHAHYETSLVVVSFYGYEIWRHKQEMVKPFLGENTCFLNFFQQ